MTGEALVDLVETFRSGGEGPGAYLEQVRRRVESRDPEIRAFVPESNRWERVETDLKDLSNAEEQLPLYGIPVGIKDIFHVDGLETRAGADLPAETLAGDQATAVRRLRQAGAVILGKTVTAEFAYFDPGPTRNPHDLERTPGGSSSGSAAAVAAGMCPIALGTQTAGSVIRPAAFCGVVGYKPSYGRIPMEGVIPFAPTLDHVGLFTGEVDGAQLAASLLVDGWESVDAAERPVLGIPAKDYLEQASATGQRAFEAQRSELARDGYDIRELSNVLADIDSINDAHRTLMEAEGALTHNQWYETFENRYSDALSDLIDRGRAVTVEAIAAARSKRDRLREKIEQTMTEAGVDVLISPAAPGPAPRGIEDTGDPVMNVPWTFAGLPAITVPQGAPDGMPVGLQCVSRFGKDEQLLRWARKVDAAT